MEKDHRPKTSPVPRQRAVWESLALAASMLLAVGAGVIGVWTGSKASIKANFQRELMDLARTAATLVDSDLHARIRHPDQLNNPDYVAAVTPLRRMRKAVPDIHYIYTLVRDGRDVRFVLDAADPGAKSANGTAEQSGVWEVYSHGSATLLAALGSPGRRGEVAADAEPTSDEWGTFMSGMAPLLNSAGHQIGIVGVDVDASNYLWRIEHARNRLLFGLLPAVALSLVFGCTFYRVRMRGLIDAHDSCNNALSARLAAEALAATAQQDKLTGLATRSVFIEQLELALTRVGLGLQPWAAVLFLDFDRFKLVNDSMGHEAGDELLRIISSRLSAWIQTHEGRVAGSERNLVCRFGGDEFLILLNDLRADHEAREVATQLLATLARPYSIFGTEVHSTASIGIVSSNTGKECAADLIRNADVAMYEAKRAGRACSVVFDESMQKGLERQMILETALRRAFGTQELYLEYQPIVNLDCGRQIYVEALLRWRHPTLGAIAPGEFVPIAEDSGLIVELGRWVRRAACEQMAAWLQVVPSLAPAMISVNVSRAELALGTAFLEEIKTDLEHAGLRPECLQLEVTEREVMRDPRAALSLLRQLRELGVKLAMDDFGTGNSSLYLLRDLPFNAIKIDRSLLVDLYTRREVLAVIQATIHLIENLGMMSVAEGVEEALQVSMLQSLGCRAAQGYLFGRPMSAASVVQPKAGIDRPAIGYLSTGEDLEGTPLPLAGSGS